LRLARGVPGSYFRSMKRCFILLCLLLVAPLLRGQDSSAVSRAEMEENYKKLKGDVDLLLEIKGSQAKKIQELEAEIVSLRSQMSKPQGNYASAEDVKTLADAIKQVDQKRIADNKELRSDVTDAIGKLGKTLVAQQQPRPQTNPTPTPKDTSEKPDKPPKSDKTQGGSVVGTAVSDPKPPSDEGFYYKIKDGDTFRKIAHAYTDQGVKVNWEDIAKANPNMKDTGLIVGKQLWIPAPKPPASASTTK
jgi:hypothetical protein